MKEKPKSALEEFKVRLDAEFGSSDVLEAQMEAAKEAAGADSVALSRDVLATRLAREGYLVEIFVGRTRFTTKLRPEDLGLDSKDPASRQFFEDYVSLGSKHLIPKEILDELNRIEASIRHVPRRLGIQTHMGVFVPDKNLPEMKQKIEELKARYFEIRDVILDAYDEMRARTEQAYREYAPQAFRLIRKDMGYVPAQEEIDTFVAQAMALFPSKETIRETFKVRVHLGIVPTTAYLAEQEAKLRLVREREDLYRQELELLERKLSEESRIQAEKERLRLQILREEARTKLEQERAKRRAIEEAVAQARAEYLPEMEQLFSDLAGTVYGIIYDTLARVRDALKENGSLRPSDTRSLKCMVERVETLLFQDNPDVRQWLDEIRAVVDTPPEKRSAGVVRDVLDDIRAEAARVILSLGRIPRVLEEAEIDIDRIEHDLEEIARTREARPQITFFDREEGREAPARQLRYA